MDSVNEKDIMLAIALLERIQDDTGKAKEYLDSILRLANDVSQTCNEMEE